MLKGISKAKKARGVTSSTVMKVKLPALKGGTSREGISFYIVPLPASPVGRGHALKGGACGALAGQPPMEKKWEWVSP